MNLFTFNSKLLKTPIIRSLLITLCLLSSYHILVSTEVVKPSDGINQGQKNFILLQKYVYQNFQKPKVVLVGSSITAHLPVSSDTFHVINLGLSGGCAQTGIEVVRRKYLKPAILMVEINETLRKRVDAKTIDSIYNPLLYYTRLYLPMFRQEYQPFNTFLSAAISLKNHFIINNHKNYKKIENKPEKYISSTLVNMVKNQVIKENKAPLSEKEEKLLRRESEYLKHQIAQLRKDGVRVILFNVPGERRVQTTVRGQQIQSLMRELFPANNFEWLIEPPPRHWRTLDGVHLVSSDAKDYAAFLRNQLLSKKADVSPFGSSQPILNSQ